jgi:hypothetical protein
VKFRFAICGLRLFFSVLFALICGCEDRDSRGVARVAPESVRGAATISGRVTLLGTPPAMKPISNAPCHDSAGTIYEETVVVGENGGLGNVFVYIENGPRVDGSKLPQTVLDQVSCRYTPHVVGVVAHAPLVVKSSDPTFHNTHYTPKENPPANFALEAAGMQKTVRFAAPEIFHVRCDVHPWMSAYIGVFDNEFFAVSSGKDGGFTIDNLPAGTYTLVAWHELYGRQKREIEVKDGGSVEADFQFAVP